MKILITCISFIVLGLFGLSGCGSSRGPYESTAELRRDIVRAERLYQQAVEKIGKQLLPEAEKLLRGVLTYDLYHGPAHNNLGVILLGQGRLYDAAEEFEWARKLLPGHPEPRANLAIAFERGGRHADALEAAQSALEVRPGHLGAIKTIAWITVNEGQANQAVSDQLSAIVARANEPEWREWAQQQRLRIEAKFNP
jgi:tetratricopeptide (TPR) repeat protein